MSSSRLSYPVLWMFLFAAVAMLEGYTLGRPGHGDTLSESVRQHFRFDPVGRFIFLPLWCWLSVHWVLKAPGGEYGLGWQDGAAVGVGLLWAIVETVRR